MALPCDKDIKYEESRKVSHCIQFVVTPCTPNGASYLKRYTVRFMFAIK